MGRLYDYDFYDDVSYIANMCCGRNKEQKEIDETQNELINKEIERSTGVDEKQADEIDKINDKITELDRPPYYETDEQ